MSDRIRFKRARLEALLAGDDAALRAALRAAIAAAPRRNPIDEARLRALWGEGLAVGAIASALKERFGRVYNALQRLGLRRPMGWKPVGYRSSGGAGKARRAIDRDQLAAMAAAGQTHVAMAAALGCSTDTVAARLKAWGIARVRPPNHGGGRPRKVDEAALRAMWGDAGRTIEDIAAALKVTASTIGTAAKRIGLAPRRGLVVPRVRAPKKAPARAPRGIDAAALRALVEAGLTAAEIAARHDVAAGTAARWMREHDIRPPRRDPAPDPAVAARLRTMWAADATLAAMAAALDLSRDQVRLMAARLGLRPRGRGWRPAGQVRAAAARRAGTPAGPPPKATPPTSPAEAAAEQDAIAAWIAQHGVTRCPTTAVLPTQAALPAEAAGVLRQRAAERAAREQEEHRARSLRAVRARGFVPVLRP